MALKFKSGSGVFSPQAIAQRQNEIQQMQHAMRGYRSSHVTSRPTSRSAPVATSRRIASPRIVNAINNPKPVTVAPVKDPMQAYNDRLNKVFDQRLNSQVDAFKANRDKAITGINGQIGQVQQLAYNNRNQEDVVAKQKANALKELMAANGINASGENVTANVNLNNARDAALNNINTQTQNTVGQLRNQIADINNPDRLNAIKQQIESDRAAALAGAIQHQSDQAFNQNQFDQTMGWNYWQAQNANAQAQSQALAQIQAYRNMIQQLGGNFTNGSGGGEQYQRDLAQAVQRAGIPANQLGAFNWIIQHESSFNPNAKNPNSSAYGYGQFLNSTRRNYERKTGLNYNNPVNQLIMAYQYMNDRYGSPQNAMRFRQANGYY